MLCMPLVISFDALLTSYSGWWVSKKIPSLGTSDAPLQGMFVNYLPIPLVLLTEANGSQNVHIAPEAFTVASAEFPDQINVWQNALHGSLKGNLASVRCKTDLSCIILIMISSPVLKSS